MRLDESSYWNKINSDVYLRVLGCLIYFFGFCFALGLLSAGDTS